MSKYTTVLERARAQFGAPELALDRVYVRRDRRERNRRMTAGAVTLAILAAGSLLTYAAIRSTPQPAVPDEPPVLPSTPSAWRPMRSPGGRISSIAAGGPGLVAVGSKAIDDSRAAIWTSSDGRSWSMVEGNLGESAFVDVAAGGPGLVAITNGNRGYWPQDGYDSPVWTSTDGAAWNRTPRDRAFDGAFIRAVIAGGPGVIAVGADRAGPQAWYSTDGITWELASVPATPEGVYIDEDHVDAWMRDVAELDGRLIAVGSIAMRMGPNSYRYDPVMWSSTDGRTWIQVPLDATVFTSTTEFRGIAAGPRGFVAVGQHLQPPSCCAEMPGVWWSPDGLRWRSVSQGNAAFVSTRNSDFGVHAIAAGPSGYVAVGLDSRCLYFPRACIVTEIAVWVSSDGRTWSRVASDPVFEVGTAGPILMRTVAAWGTRFVAAGEYWAYEGEPPAELRDADAPTVARDAAWISEPPSSEE